MVGKTELGRLDGYEGERATRRKTRQRKGGKSKYGKVGRELEPIQVNCV